MIYCLQEKRYKIGRHSSSGPDLPIEMVTDDDDADDDDDDDDDVDVSSSQYRVAIDPLSQEYIQDPKFEQARRGMLTVTIKAGEMLYLPALWLHHVCQEEDSEGLCISVNYWYDMRYEENYCYFDFVQNIMREFTNPSADEIRQV